MAGHFQNTFSLLSRFSKLETLQLYSSQQDDRHTAPIIPLESGAFSQLRNLTLYDFGPHTTLSILNCLASVTRLTQIALEINFNSDNKDCVSDIDGFYNTMLIPTICAQTPHLTHLIIRPIRNDEFYVAINNPSLEILASLHLQSLTLAQSHTNVEYLAKLFPHIQTLRWPNQSVTLDQLRQFTAYHQLEHLSMKFDFKLPHITETLCDRAVLLTIPCVLESDFGNLDHLSQVEIHKLLVGLIGMWSRPLVLQQITPFDYPHRDFAAKRRLERLNKELERVKLALF
ncbi:hypothetical protein B0J17DRAFT_773086 [Rhizoctonia solani]|nr:hypothetical protein B0J17DRAFT_773086 [Rhizoctonia solani]